MRWRSSSRSLAPQFIAARSGCASCQVAVLVTTAWYRPAVGDIPPASHRAVGVHHH
ncbi:putative lipoprotein [Mycobacterium ulcerans str. Harvey]|uniref:Lipoprotein n=1 Tax=Mycobacterium ulcerans str. Harvey TaxID=1299332 RepID=A0ABN0R3A3_MYCUL|nr:putative lipoprotein [Mycobacterium ulcerans str. Harvey]